MYISLEYTTNQFTMKREVEAQFVTGEALQRARQLPIYES
jgi:hypothetical protein